MGPAPVVPRLDVLHGRGPGGHVIGEIMVVVHLGLQVREERLGHRVDAPMVSTNWYWVFVLVRDGFDDGKDFAGDVAFEATDGVSFTFAVFGAFFQVFLGG